MFFLVEDGFAEEDADVEVLVDVDGLGHGAGVVQHGEGWRSYFDLEVGLFAGRGSLFEFFLDVVDAGDQFFELFVEEVLELLGVRFDLYDDVPVVLFELGQGQRPVRLDQLFAFCVYGLEEHIGFVVDGVDFQEGLECFLQVVVF